LAPDGGSTLVGATEMVAQQVADRASAVAGCLCAARSEAAGEHVRFSESRARWKGGWRHHRSLCFATSVRDDLK
jgi:hypothetical protein